MKKFVSLATGAVLAVTLTATPATAHHDDPLSFVACAFLRTNPNHVVDHAHPYFLNDHVLLAHCETHDVDTRCRYNVAWWINGPITGPYPGYRCKEIPE